MQPNHQLITPVHGFVLPTLQERIDSAELWQLIYCSRACGEFTPEELATLLAKSRVNNQRREISGMLVYRDGCFLQVMEGPRAHVEHLFTVIGRNPRHDQVTVLLSGRVTQRSFGDWRMGIANPVGLETLPGYSDFFSESFSPSLFTHNAGLARKLLLAFRDTAWRKQVSDG